MKRINSLNRLKRLLAAGFALLVFGSIAHAQIASGGNYTLTQVTIASGGASGAGASTGGNFTIEGTIGQPATGKPQNAPYKIQSGFWTAPSFAPTAANAAVSGRVTNSQGQGIRNVLISMSSATGETRSAISSAFGYFRFDDVAAGRTYIFTAKSRRFTFTEPVLVRSIIDYVDDINFIAADSTVNF